MALPMTLIIVAGEIDLSVESMAGLASALLGFLWAAGVPLAIAIPLVLARRRPRRPPERPARGPRRPAVARRDPRHARPVPRPRPDRARAARRQRLPAGLHGARLRARARDADPVAVRHLPRRSPPCSAIVLHRTWIGRQIYAIGKNTGAARFSGVRVARVRIGLFVLSGLIAALAGIILTSRLSSARADAGAGHDPHGRDGRPARRREHLRRLGHDPGRRSGGPRGGGHAERPPPRQRDGRGPEHRPRVCC